MMARFRRRERKKKFRGGGNIDVAAHDDGQTSAQILAKKMQMMQMLRNKC